MTTILKSNDKNTENENDELLSVIRENFNIAQESYNEQRIKALEDFRFREGEQWEEGIRSQREREGRPCLVMNQIPQFIRQVVNNQKINRPSINVKAVDANADTNTAKIYQAIIKNIEEQSFAENAYDIAFDTACTGGEGYFRIITDYFDPMSFDQEIYIKPIENPFSVYIDPNFKPDYTDLEWAFVFDTMSKDKFKRLYPDAECNTIGWYDETNNEWISKDTVRIAEYFYADYESMDIVLLSNGLSMTKEDWDNADNKEDVTVVKKRKSQKRVIKWVKTNGYEILEETTFPGQYIPIIPVFADTYIVNGKRVFEGVVRQAKNPQMAYNFWTSAEAEMIALAPKAPYLVAEGQIEGYEGQWAAANNKSFPFLTYKVISSNGQPVGAPQRNQFDPNINTIINAKQASKEDLKSTTGIYDPSLGKEQKEASGIALITKQRQAEATNFMYIDNLGKSIKLAGRILLGMIPIIYDTKRIIRIMGDVNNEDELVAINSFDEKAVILGMGKYDVSITIGPYGENQRQEATKSMLALMQMNPEIANLIGDLFVGNQDWVGAKEIAERLKLLLPPALQKNNTELPPELAAKFAQVEQEYQMQLQQAQMQMQQMQEIIANVTAEYNKAEAQLKNKQAEIESNERINAENNRVKLILAGIKEESADSRLAFQQELNYTANKQAMGQPNIPMQNDTLVLPGVNDPITQAQQQEEVELTPEEQQKLLMDLDQYTTPENM